MGKLKLSVAVGDYDRTRPLIDGTVQIDGVDPVFMALDPEEIFFRAFRHAEFDICELSLSSFTVRTAAGQSDYIGLPAFLSRAFRHTSIYVRTDRIRQPSDLRGRRIGLPEYQLTACVWARAILSQDHDVQPNEVTWVRGGLEEPGRKEKIPLELPSDIVIEQAPDGRSLSDLLEAGEIDALITPRAPSCFDRGAPDVGWLFADPAAAAREYYARTGVFPIMHVLGLRRSLAEAQPWLPVAVLKAFARSKAVALRKLSDTSATKVTLPFVEDHLAAVRAMMGPDFWSYGLGGNRVTLDAFLDQHHRQGLSMRRVDVMEMFHPATLETFAI